MLMTFYSTLYKNCSHYRSAIYFKVGLGLAEIIRCLCTKVVFLQIIGHCAVAWTSSIEFVACMSSKKLLCIKISRYDWCMSFHSGDNAIER